jgi:hypothetical protein
MQRGSTNISKPPHTNKAGANENERATGIETTFRISLSCAILTESCAISALEGETRIGQLARFTQINALRVSDFVREDLRH